jgi:ribosome-associated protein
MIPTLSAPASSAATASTDSSAFPSALQRAALAARIAQENKAKDVIVLDMRKITPIYDYMILMTGASRRQIHTLAEEIDAGLRRVGDARMGIEGYEVSKWIVQDYGDILVHVFDAPTREYYGLEDLWADAEKVDWERV